MSFFNADISQDTEALRLDIYFPFFTFVRSYLFSEGVVCPDKPFSVPACVQHGLVHFFYCLVSTERFFFLSDKPANLSVFPSVFYKHSCNEYRLRDRSF